MLYLNFLALNLGAFGETVKNVLADLGLEFHPANLIGMLKHMGIGMMVIFVIIGIIILATMAIQMLFSGKKVKEDK